DAVVGEVIEAVAVLSNSRRSAQTLNLAPAGTLDARVVEWQTRQFEGLVVAIPCGFKSRPAHEKKSKSTLLNVKPAVGFTLPSAGVTPAPSTRKRCGTEFTLSTRRV